MTRTRVLTPRASATAGRRIAGATGQRPGRMLLAGEHRRLVRNERASQQDRPGRRPAGNDPAGIAGLPARCPAIGRVARRGADAETGPSSFPNTS
jgi:hypothetical protein